MAEETTAGAGTKDRDQTVPDGKWAFDAAVTDVFPDMLARSIPQYEVMRDLVFRVGVTFVKPETAVVDLGCARGEALRPFISKFGSYNRFVGLDVSEPMLAAARQEFGGYPKSIVDFRTLDLRHEYPPVKASLTLGVLTIQFVPIEYRQQIIQRVFDHTIPGGAFVLVEKVLGATAKVDGLLVNEYLAMKARNGYTQEQIDRKRFSLEGVLVPVTAAWNEELLRQAGFRQVDCIWRWANFAAWLAIRD